MVLVCLAGMPDSNQTDSALFSNAMEGMMNRSSSQNNFICYNQGYPMKKSKVLIIAPRHYIKDLQDSYSNASCTISYFAEEDINPDNIPAFLKK